MILKLEKSSEMPDVKATYIVFNMGCTSQLPQLSSHPRQPYFRTEQYPTIKNNLSLPHNLNSVLHSSQSIKKQPSFGVGGKGAPKISRNNLQQRKSSSHLNPHLFSKKSDDLRGGGGTQWFFSYT